MTYRRQSFLENVCNVLIGVVRYHTPSEHISTKRTDILLNLINYHLWITVNYHKVQGFVWLFNNIAVISWWSVLLVEETTDLSQVIDKLYYIMLYISHWSRFELKTPVVIGTDCIGSCKSNYQTITITTAPSSSRNMCLFILLHKLHPFYHCDRALHNTVNIHNNFDLFTFP